MEVIVALEFGLLFGFDQPLHIIKITGINSVLPERLLSSWVHLRAGSAPGGSCLLIL